MMKKEKIVITIVLVVSCITVTPVAAKNVEDNTYQICRNDIFIDWDQLNCKKIVSEIKDDGCYNNASNAFTVISKSHYPSGIYAVGNCRAVQKRGKSVFASS